MHANKSISVNSGSHNYHNTFSSVIKDSPPSIRNLFHTSARFVLSHQNKQCGRNSVWHFSAKKTQNNKKNPNEKHTFVFNLIWGMRIKASEFRSSRVPWFLKNNATKLKWLFSRLLESSFSPNYLVIWWKINNNIDDFPL